MTQWLSFDALDTLFFRGPERFDAEAGGGSYLSGMFPPHPGTTFSALNSALLNSAPLPEDASFEHDEGPRARPGHHKCRGPWPYHAEKGLLLPAPLSLLKDKQGTIHLLRPSSAAHKTDLGVAVQLPEGPADAQEVKAAEDMWLPVGAYQSWLQGQAPAADSLVEEAALWAAERRTGLARDPQDRTAIEGHLYSAAHTRPRARLRLVINLPDRSAAEAWCPASHMPLGGEGRAVWVNALDTPLAVPDPPSLGLQPDGKLHYTLSLITPGLGANWGSTSPGLPLRPGVPGEVVCCALARPLRIGGFDTKAANGKGMPERVRSARAAGCVWWMQAVPADRSAVLALHDTCIGAGSNQGYGHVLVGAW